MPRNDGRSPTETRPVSIEIDSFGYGEGTALIRMGHTTVLCAATIEAGVPPWMRGQGRGWITGEYSLLPRSTTTRNRRERQGAGGRTQEIQRLIGRALRAAADLSLLGDYTITIDCDVLQADGGTRTAAITGGYVALALALHRLVQRGNIAQSPIIREIAAISAGYVAGVALLDLEYSEDSAADMDCNVVLTGSGEIIEVQCTAEAQPIARTEFDALIDLAASGVRQLVEVQRSVLLAAGVGA
jgi:ribonuclease PH